MNAAGYLVLILLLYLPALHPFQRALRWLLILYTLATILEWVAIGSRNMVGYLDKAVEIVLIVLLLIQDRQMMRQQA